jgi:hypothetical protein
MRIHADPDAQHHKKLGSPFLTILLIIKENYQHTYRDQQFTLQAEEVLIS